VGFPGDEVAH